VLIKKEEIFFTKKKKTENQLLCGSYFSTNKNKLPPFLLCLLGKKISFLLKEKQKLKTNFSV
jgi:hypothetical protein